MKCSSQELHRLTDATFRARFPNRVRLINVVYIKQPSICRLQPWASCCIYTTPVTMTTEPGVLWCFRLTEKGTEENKYDWYTGCHWGADVDALTHRAREKTF